MNNTKSPKNVSLKNQLELWLFCALIGAVAGALVWILLKIMAVGTEFLWKWLPGKTPVKGAQSIRIGKEGRHLITTT